MEELFKRWLYDNHPDLVVDNTESVIRLMKEAYEEGYETGKVSKADDSFVGLLDNNDCVDGCIL